MQPELGKPRPYEGHLDDDALHRLLAPVLVEQEVAVAADGELRAVGAGQDRGPRGPVGAAAQDAVGAALIEIGALGDLLLGDGVVVLRPAPLGHGDDDIGDLARRLDRAADVGVGHRRHAGSSRSGGRGAMDVVPADEGELHTAHVDDGRGQRIGQILAGAGVLDPGSVEVLDGLQNARLTAVCDVVRAKGDDFDAALRGEQLGDSRVDAEHLASVVLFPAGEHRALEVVGADVVVRDQGRHLSAIAVAPDVRDGPTRALRTRILGVHVNAGVVGVTAGKGPIPALTLGDRHHADAPVGAGVPG